jgi:hypothetical protein
MRRVIVILWVKDKFNILNYFERENIAITRKKNFNLIKYIIY